VILTAPESHRDSIHQPGVARHALPWVIVQQKFQPCRGCITIRRAFDSTLSGLMKFGKRFPGVGAPRQHRADCSNPFGIAESARGLAHSKTLRVVGSGWNSRQRLGLRRPSAAFPSISPGLVRAGLAIRLRLTSTRQVNYPGHPCPSVVNHRD